MNRGGEPDPSCPAPGRAVRLRLVAAVVALAGGAAALVIAILLVLAALG